MAKDARSWSRKDSLLVLASYVEKPARIMVPPLRERERLANLTGHSVQEVTARLWMFAALDPDNSATGDAGKRETELWQQYADDRLELMLAADALLEERKRIPRYLS